MEDQRKLYFIGTASRLADMHPTSLRKYERAGLLEPARTSGKIRLYADADVRRLRQIKRLTETWGMNMRGVEQALSISDKAQILKCLLQNESMAENVRRPLQDLVNQMLTLLELDSDGESDGDHENSNLAIAR